MTVVPKSVYTDRFDDIVNQYHSTNKAKPVDVKSSMHIDSSKEINYKDPKFKIDDIVTISKY